MGTGLFSGSTTHQYVHIFTEITVTFTHTHVNMCSRLMLTEKGRFLSRPSNLNVKHPKLNNKKLFLLVSLPLSRLFSLHTHTHGMLGQDNIAAQLIKICCYRFQIPLPVCLCPSHTHTHTHSSNITAPYSSYRHNHVPGPSFPSGVDHVLAVMYRKKDTNYW